MRGKVQSYMANMFYLSMQTSSLSHYICQGPDVVYTRQTWRAKGVFLIVPPSPSPLSLSLPSSLYCSFLQKCRLHCVNAPLGTPPKYPHCPFSSSVEMKMAKQVCSKRQQHFLALMHSGSGCKNLPLYTAKCKLTVSKPAVVSQ